MVYIDGYQVADGWRRSVTSTYPGRHNVHVQVQSAVGSLGSADATVDVHPGQFVELGYMAPLFGFSGGSLGFGPQRSNSGGFTVAIVAISLAIVLVALIIVVAFSV